MKKLRFLITLFVVFFLWGITAFGYTSNVIDSTKTAWISDGKRTVTYNNSNANDYVYYYYYGNQQIFSVNHSNKQTSNQHLIFHNYSSSKMLYFFRTSATANSRAYLCDSSSCSVLSTGVVGSINIFEGGLSLTSSLCVSFEDFSQITCPSNFPTNSVLSYKPNYRRVFQPYRTSENGDFHIASVGIGSLYPTATTDEVPTYSVLRNDVWFHGQISNSNLPSGPYNFPPTYTNETFVFPSINTASGLFNFQTNEIVSSGNYVLGIKANTNQFYSIPYGGDYLFPTSSIFPSSSKEDFSTTYYGFISDKLYLVVGEGEWGSIGNGDGGEGGTGGGSVGNVTLSNCEYENITYNNGWCPIDLNTLTGSCSEQDINYMQCEANFSYNNQNSTLTFKNLINPINFPNIWRANGENTFTFSDSRGWTSGTNDPIFAVSGDIPIIGYTLYDTNSGSGGISDKVYRVQTYGSGNTPNFIIGQFNNNIDTTIRNFNVTTYFSNIQKQFQFELLGKTINVPGFQNEYKFGLDFWGYCPLNTSRQVCEGSDGYIYIDGEKQNLINDNRDNLQDYINETNNPNNPIEGGTVPTAPSTGMCSKYYTEWEAGNFTNIDLNLSIIPCGFSYVIKKVTTTIKNMFNFGISLDKEKKEGDFWEWVRENADAFIPTTYANFMGYSGSGNIQVNEIFNGLGNNNSVNVSENMLGIAKIIAKIVLNIGGFVFMITSFIPTSQNTSGESIIGVAWKILLMIFFVIIIFAVEIIANFTNINPFGLMEIFNFFDLGYRTAVYMILIGIMAYTIRNIQN